MKSLMLVVACVSLACSAALAQFAGGVNIDFNSPTGPGAGQPSILYAGAAGQSGYWNPVNPPYGLGATSTIRNLANSANAVTLVVESTNSAAAFTFNNANTSGDSALLLNDIHDVGASGFTLYSIGPFAGGVYDVITYAVAPDSSTSRTGVSVYTSSTGPSPETSVGGAIPAGGATALGVTHAAHRVAVARGERIYVSVRAVTGPGSVNGLQIKPVTGITRLYVRQGAPANTQTGLSWAEAITELQRAISVANDTPGVTELWITQGLHYPDRVLYSTGDRDATFAPRSNLLLLGGFAGTEATPAERVLGPATQLYGRALARHVLTLSGVSGVRIEDMNINDGNNELTAASPNSGGAAVRVAAASATFSRLRFANNVSVGAGGVFNVSGASSVTIEDSDTTGNQAYAGSFLSMTGGSVVLNRVRVASGTTTTTTGGVFDVIGASTSLTLNNCLIANNQQPSWIIDASAGGTLGVFNCTFANNKSTVSTNVGVTGPAGTTIRNSIIYGNVSNSGTPTMGGVLRLNAGFVAVTDNIVQQWNGTLTGPADLNFDADPRFTFPSAAGLLPPGAILGAGQYHLGSRSPARDSGWNSAAPAGTDLNGNPRIFDDPYFPNTGFSGGTLDRGCFEAQSASAVCPGDIGRTGGVPGADGERNNNDFIVFIDYFFAANPLADVGRTGGVPPGDGAFDNNDFVIFIDQFFTFCP